MKGARDSFFLSLTCFHLFSRLRRSWGTTGSLWYLVTAGTGVDLFMSMTFSINIGCEADSVLFLLSFSCLLFLLFCMDSYVNVPLPSNALKTSRHREGLCNMCHSTFLYRDLTVWMMAHIQIIFCVWDCHSSNGWRITFILWRSGFTMISAPLTLGMCILVCMHTHLCTCIFVYVGKRMEGGRGVFYWRAKFSHELCYALFNPPLVSLYSRNINLHPVFVLIDER